MTDWGGDSCPRVAMRENICRILADSGLTRRDAAEKIGLSKSAFSRILQTRTADSGPSLHRCDLDWLWALCDLLNTDPTTLMGWTPPDEPVEPPSGADPSPF